MGDVAVLSQPKTGLEGVPFEAILKAEPAEDDQGDWIVEGYAATSDLDLQGDVIKPEALDKAADGAVGLTVLHNHDPDQEIGKVVAARGVEGRGGQARLWVKVEVSKDEPKIWGKIKQGVINKFSIRGKIISAHHDRSAGREANVIEEFVLLEISLVAVPANPEAKTLRAYTTVTKTLSACLSEALDEFVKSGGVIPQENGNDGGRIEETVMEKTKAEEYAELCAEKGVEPFAAVVILEGASEEDALKALDGVHEARVAVWKELHPEKAEEEYPYPKPAAGKPVQATDKKRKELISKLKMGLKEQMTLLDELGEMTAEPAKGDEGASDVDPKALELLDALISKASDDDKKLLAQIRQAAEARVSKDEGGDDAPDSKEKDAGEQEPAPASAEKDEVEALKEVAKQLNARMAELEKKDEEKYTFEQVAQIVAGVLQKKK